VADALTTTQPARKAARRRRELSPLVVDADGLASLLNCSVRTVRAHDTSGKLPAPLRIGGRVVWREVEIRAWVNAGAPDRVEWEARKAARRAARRR
jgi:predicted DNA-binding transcriptional regulator AlpA